MDQIMGNIGNAHEEITKIKVTYHKKDKDYVAEVLGNSKHIIKSQKVIHNKFRPWKYTVIIEVQNDKYARDNLAIIISRLDYACQRGRKIEYFRG